MKSYSLFALLLVAASFTANAKLVPQKRILISVGDLKETKSKEWKKETCLQVYKLANQIVDRGVDVTCREFSTESFVDKDLAALSKSYDYHIKILRSRGDEGITTDVTNWNRKYDSDFTNLGWSFQDSKDSKAKKEDAMAKVMGNLFLYINNEDAYKAALLVNGAIESDQIAFDEKKQVFKDKATNSPISASRAYSIFESESPRKKNYLRTGIEIGVQLSAAMAIYYKNLVFNEVDFDYELGSGLKGKYITGEAIKFDDNDKASNYGHTYAGVMYYQTARANGFNSLESALIGFASSAAWETLEYHEVFSINDQILTPIGGYVIGEATYQLSCALLNKNSIAAKTLGYTVNPNLGIAHAIDGAWKKGDKFASQPDCKKPRWSDISVYIGLDNGQKAYEGSKNNDYVLGLKAEVVNIDNYDKAGKHQSMVYDSAVTKLMVESNGNQGVTDLKVVAQVVMAAYNQKNLKKDSSGQLSGYDVILGIGSGSTWTDRGTKEDSVDEDFYGTVNILGATAHARVHMNGFILNADFGVYGDFAMVKSYALEPYKASQNGDLSKESSIVRKRSYYWGSGASAIGAISVSRGNFEVGYEGQFSTANSIDERNRIESESGAKFKDSLSTNKIYIRYSITKNLSIQLSREIDVRTGSVNGDFDTKGTERRTMGTLIYKF
ncbi:DUF3943 domain-containing protein [Bacteriovorax sp. PP10]|uniref:DUF3943 domain-containing protein n=1 Tax=Bacteriovorax antarcticus TaxID=3088717 RepID=A0ABU5VSN5_9BACT|nr:DUF3943 domain-containing protein [Bacteriovorax sp. PP10]MEA9355607.1 DUF3943 domain-containing protein [Bacteriovorax sp. PP10]